MLRYIAASCDPGANLELEALVSAVRRQGVEWEVVVDESDLKVLVRRAPRNRKPLLLGKGGGVVLGDVFRNPAATDRGEVRQYRFDTQVIEEIIETRGRVLVVRYWGNYVAIVRNSRSGRRWVLRSPAATLPCFHTRYGAVDIHFSSMESVARLGLCNFTINWSHLTRGLLGPVLSKQTDLNEVDELLPGTCSELGSPALSPQQYWNPVAIAAENPIEDFTAAARTLRQITGYCVGAWATDERHVLHCLSGGLDSSIVLGCLMACHGKPDVTCLTYFHEGVDSDERTFARCATRRYKCRHDELRHRTDLDFEQARKGERTANCPRLRIPAIDRIDADHARAVGADVIFKGHGGDELFCRHHALYYVADFLRRRGIRPELVMLLFHSAVMEGTSVWTALKGAIAAAYLPRRWNPAEIFLKDRENQCFLARDWVLSLTDSDRWELPFVASTWRCPPGKLWQISLVAPARQFEGPHSRVEDAPTIAPLLSQPVIEACLRIPTYLQIRDRGERAVARAAFADVLPSRILRRRSKGGAEHTAWQMLLRNWRFVRELLLDGKLVRERIADRRRLAAALTEVPSSALKVTVPIFDLVGAEIWAQRWENRSASG